MFDNTYFILYLIFDFQEGEVVEMWLNEFLRSVTPRDIREFEGFLSPLDPNEHIVLGVPSKGIRRLVVGRFLIDGRIMLAENAAEMEVFKGQSEAIKQLIVVCLRDEGIETEGRDTGFVEGWQFVAAVKHQVVLATPTMMAAVTAGHRRQAQA